MKMYEDANRPGDIYVVDADCVELFVVHMAEEGAALTSVRFAKPSDDICRVHLDDESWCGLRFERQ